MVLTEVHLKYFGDTWIIASKGQRSVQILVIAPKL